MGYERVLLVSPPSSSYLGAARPPQNLGYLARALMDSGIEYDVLDMRLGYKLKHLLKKIDKFRPDLIGVTLVSLEYKRSYALISAVKSRYPDKDIIVGGPHLTVLQETVLEECSDIDYGVVHEGELTLREFCLGNIPKEQIKGLIRRDGDKVIYNGHRSYPKDLDTIHFPTYEKFELNRYIQEMPFNSSRGCPLQCVFCPNKMITKKFRWRSAQNVVDEIEYWYMRGYNIFNYDDDNFTFFNERVYEICDEIERREINDIELRCSNGIRADRVNRKLLKRMRDVGFNYIAFGVDGGNNKMLRLNKKGETIEQIEQAVSDACELGFDVKIFCITGMPGETMEDIEDSIRIVKKYPIKRVILNNPIPYPGTELFETIKAKNWFIVDPEVYLNEVTENENIPVFETPELSRQDRMEILTRIRQVEKWVNRQAIKRMYKRGSWIAVLIGYIFASRIFQRMFFRNMMFRRIMEWIRHRRMLAKRKMAAQEG
jgi:radical SAM superfamily enzyme YgiQ (UPF0313 family)